VLDQAEPGIADLVHAREVRRIARAAGSVEVDVQRGNTTRSSFEKEEYLVSSVIVSNLSGRDVCGAFLEPLHLLVAEPRGFVLTEGRVAEKVRVGPTRTDVSRVLSAGYVFPME
jgi:hypothetical protein